MLRANRRCPMQVIAVSLIPCLVSTLFWGCGGGKKAGIPDEILRLARSLANPQSVAEARNAVEEVFSRLGIPLVTDLSIGQVDQFKLESRFIPPLADALLRDERLTLGELVDPLIQSGTTTIDARPAQLQDFLTFLQQRVEESFAEPRSSESVFGLLVGPGAGQVPSGGSPPTLTAQTELSIVQAILTLAELARSGLFVTQATASPSRAVIEITVIVGGVVIVIELSAVAIGFIIAALALAVFHIYAAGVDIDSVTPAQNPICLDEETDVTASVSFVDFLAASGKDVVWSQSKGLFTPTTSTTDGNGQASSKYTGTQEGDATLYARIHLGLQVPLIDLVASRTKEGRGNITVKKLQAPTVSAQINDDCTQCTVQASEAPGCLVTSFEITCNGQTQTVAASGSRESGFSASATFSITPNSGGPTTATATAIAIGEGGNRSPAAQTSTSKDCHDQGSGTGSR